jgi:hypothetical protein
MALMATNGQYELYHYPFQVLEFGGISIKGPHIAIASDGFIPGTGSDLVLGIDALRGLRIAIAYNRKRLFISTFVRPEATLPGSP